MTKASDSKSFADGKLAEVLELIAAKFSAGQSVDLEAEIAEHPKLEVELRKLFPTMELMCDWGSKVDVGRIPICQRMTLFHSTLQRSATIRSSRKSAEAEWASYMKLNSYRLIGE